MPELGQLLREAAGDPPDLPDVEEIMRRARPRKVARRVVAGAAALVLGLAGWAGTSTVLTRVDDVPLSRDFRPDTDAGPARDLREGLLEPGTYAGHVGRYALRLTTRNDAWGVAVAEPDWLALTYRQYVLHLQVWDRVVPPAAGKEATQQPPRDLAAWLVAHPRLSTGSPTEGTLGGLAATRVDARVVEPLTTTPRECTARCVILARVADDGEPVDLEVGQHARFLVMGPPGDEIVVFYRAPEEEFPVLDGAVEELVAGLHLETSD